MLAVGLGCHSVCYLLAAVPNGLPHHAVSKVFGPQNSQLGILPKNV